MANSLWPVVSEIFGTVVVTIPQAEYESLLQCRLKLSKKLVGDGPGRRSTSRVFRDLELSLCVDDCLDRRLTYAATRAECLARFGSERTPSQNSIARYARERRESSS